MSIARKILEHKISCLRELRKDAEEKAMWETYKKLSDRIRDLSDVLIEIQMAEMIFGEEK